MATIIEIINSAFGVYMKTCNREELTRAAESLEALFGNEAYAKAINDKNRENAQFLSIKIQLKIHAAEYFCAGYENADFLALKSYAESAAAKCKNLGFAKTGALCQSVLACADAADRIMFDAVALKLRICDYDDRCVAKDADECRQVSEELTKKITAAGALEFPKNIFTDGADFPDVKAQIVRDLTDLRATADKMIAAFSKAQAEEIMRTGAEDITEELNARHYEYYPTVGANRLARVITVCTPLGEEAEILAWACAGGAKIYRVQALAFEGMESASVNAVFDEFARCGADCVIYGMPHFRKSNKSDFYRSLMRFGRMGRRVYLVADDGTRGVYDEALSAATGEYNSLDVSFQYLSLPDFTQTIDIMQSLGMLKGDGSDIDEVRKNMPFMGFAGLNEAVKAFNAGVDWKKIAIERSQDNFTAAQKYMLRLARQALFIDGGWGNYHEDIVVHKTKSFDYDDIRVVNPDNIRKIMEGNFTLFQKCGMISSYCLLCGSSAADWTELDIELKSERLTEASKLVMRALGVPIVPRVEVLEELESKGAGGTCYEGGKRIVYKHSCVKDFDWTSKAVCHECFHAFQRYAENEPWQDWYETELHVTPGRIEQWRYNESDNRYRRIDKDREGYMIQILEADARAFENDCLGKNDSSGQILNLVNLD